METGQKSTTGSCAFWQLKNYPANASNLPAISVSTTCGIVELSSSNGTYCPTLLS
jgi:hypothetical protein